MMTRAIWAILLILLICMTVAPQVEAKGSRKRTTTSPTPTNVTATPTSSILVSKTTDPLILLKTTVKGLLCSGAKPSGRITNGTRPAKGSARRQQKQGNRTRRQISPFGFGGGGFPSFGTGSGTAISAANAAMGQSLSNGNTFTDRFGNSRSTASGFSSGYNPSTTSIATSNSQGSNPYGMTGFGRRKRQAFGYPSFGTGSGSAISAANAAMGQSLSNGNSYTDPFGNSRSVASGFSSGYAPSSTSIATSNSQGAFGGLPSYFGRKKRQAFGYGGMGLPSYGVGSGTAVSAANAAMGQSFSNGNSYTDPFGSSRSIVGGMSSGYAPSSTSIATSNSQGSQMGRRRKRQGFPMYGYPSVINGASGTGFSTANTAQGTSGSNTNTFSASGVSNSVTQGAAAGYLPSTSSIATSNSGSNVDGRRRRRDSEAYVKDSNSSRNHHTIIEPAKESSEDNTSKSTNLKRDNLPVLAVAPYAVVNSTEGQFANADKEMAADEHLDLEGEEVHGKESSERDAREHVGRGYFLVPVTVVDEPSALQQFNYGPVLPYGYMQSPTARNANSQLNENNMFGLPPPPVWDPTRDASFTASIQAAHAAVHNSGGQGNTAGMVAVSANKADGSVYAGKLVDYNIPISYPCNGKECGVDVAATTALPVAVTEIQRDVRDMATTANLTTALLNATVAPAAIGVAHLTGSTILTVTEPSGLLTTHVALKTATI